MVAGWSVVKSLTPIRRKISSPIHQRISLKENRNSKIASAATSLRLVFDILASNIIRVVPVALAGFGLYFAVKSGLISLGPLGIGIIAALTLGFLALAYLKPKYALALITVGIGLSMTASTAYAQSTSPLNVTVDILYHYREQLAQQVEEAAQGQISTEEKEAAQVLWDNLQPRAPPQTEQVSSEDAAEYYPRATLVQETPTGLLSSHGGDASLLDWAFTYDQGMAAIDFSRAGMFERAEKILAFYQAEYDAQMQRGEPFRGFATAYDANTREVVEHQYNPGPNVFIGFGILHYSEASGDKSFLPLAEAIAEPLITLHENRAIRSTEEKIDLYAYLKALYEVTGEERYEQVSKEIYDQIKSAYNAQLGYFIRGDIPVYDNGNIIGYRPDTAFATDVQAMAVMVFGVEGLEEMGVDVDRLLAVTEEKAKVTVTYIKPDGTEVTVTGFEFDEQKNMITPEWTAQMVIAYRIAGNDEKADDYLGQLDRMVYKGTLPYATKEDTPTGHGWNTPFGKISLAGTAYYYLSLIHI